MVALIKDNGVMENKMVEGYTVIKKGLRELAFGAEEKKLNGSSDIDGLVPYWFKNHDISALFSAITALFFSS